MRSLVVVVVMAGLLLLPGCGGDGGHPRFLEGPDSKGDWYSIAYEAEPGESVSVGNFIRLLPGVTDPVQIQSIELVEPKGLAVVGIALNGPRRQFGMIGTQKGFPLPLLEQDRLSMPGAVIAPDESARTVGLAVTFGLRRDGPGRGTASGFTVIFLVDGKRRQQTFLTGIALCATPGEPKPQCEPVPQPDNLPKPRREHRVP